jgi:hypothetical protein
MIVSVLLLISIHAGNGWGTKISKIPVDKSPCSVTIFVEYGET